MISTEQLTQRLGSSVLLFKQEQENFQLALMSPLQETLLKKLGKVLCIDSTHGTNMYGYQLTTLLAIDEDASGFPCAYLISERVGTDIMVSFFEAIEKRVGQLNCEVLMSDDASAYYNAWEEVWGKTTKHWLCTWHVCHSWNSHLSKITDRNFVELLLTH